MTSHICYLAGWPYNFTLCTWSHTNLANSMLAVCFWSLEKLYRRAAPLNRGNQQDVKKKKKLLCNNILIFQNCELNSGRGCWNTHASTGKLLTWVASQPSTECRPEAAAKLLLLLSKMRRTSSKAILLKVFFSLVSCSGRECWKCIAPLSLGISTGVMVKT